jgi:F0F1-type ATP synthase assembly protein I
VQAVLPDVNEQQVDNVAETSTWSTLIALLLGLGAALLGGLAGARQRHHREPVAVTA